MNKQENLTSIQMETLAKTRLESLEQQVKQGFKGFVQAATAMREIKESKIYKNEYGTWENYLKVRWGYSDGWWRKLQRSYSVVKNLENVTTGNVLPSSERQARELAPLEPEQQVEVWEKVTDRHGPNGITAAKIKAVKQELLEPKVEEIDPEDLPEPTFKVKGKEYTYPELFDWLVNQIPDEYKLDFCTEMESRGRLLYSELREKLLKNYYVK